MLFANALQLGTFDATSMTFKNALLLYFYLITQWCEYPIVQNAAHHFLAHSLTTFLAFRNKLPCGSRGSWNIAAWRSKKYKQSKKPIAPRENMPRKPLDAPRYITLTPRGWHFYVPPLGYLWGHRVNYLSKI